MYSKMVGGNLIKNPLIAVVNPKRKLVLLRSNQPVGKIDAYTKNENGC
jgi:hypothetical protein